MGMTIKDLFKISIFKDAQLIGGKDGINNEITWFNLMEIIDVVSSLEKGEFLITTGYKFDDINFSRNIIYKLKERGLSGIGVQPGYYIEKIPQHMIDQADEVDFPIIYIPKKITFSTITRNLYKELIKFQNNEGNHDSNVFRNIILDILERNYISKPEELYLNNIYLPDEEYSSYMLNLCISHQYDGIIMRTDIEESIAKIISVLEKYNCKFHSEFIRGDQIILFSKPNEISFQQVYHSLEQIINQLSLNHHNLNYILGISSKINSALNLSLAYEESSTVQRQMNKISVVKGVCRIEDIELLNLLDEAEARKSMIKFSDIVLKNILNYDKENQKNYFETLKCYLYNNCNTNETAKELYIHRHTLTYRLDKISQLFNIDFENFRCIMKYKLALLIYNIYER
ncbi:MAG: PucR family transcriptional regulator [Sedimentibacter sp.]